METYNEKLQKIGKIIMRNIQKKYPSCYEQTDLTLEKILVILDKKRELLNSKEGLSYIINIIDQVVRTKINGPNTALHDINTNKFVMDTESTIPYDKYINNNLYTSSPPSFELDPSELAKPPSNDFKKTDIADSDFDSGSKFELESEP